MVGGGFRELVTEDLRAEPSLEVLIVPSVGWARYRYKGAILCSEITSWSFRREVWREDGVEDVLVRVKISWVRERSGYLAYWGSEPIIEARDEDVGLLYLALDYWTAKAGVLFMLDYFQIDQILILPQKPVGATASYKMLLALPRAGLFRSFPGTASTLYIETNCELSLLPCSQNNRKLVDSTAAVFLERSE